MATETTKKTAPKGKVANLTFSTEEELQVYETYAAAAQGG